MGLLNGIVVKTAPYMPKFVIGKIASRYVAGDSIDDGISLVKRLNSKGFSGTLDLLGEEVTDISKASKITKSYCEILDAIEDAGVDCNISLKLSLLPPPIDISCVIFPSSTSSVVDATSIRSLPSITLLLLIYLLS